MDLCEKNNIPHVFISGTWLGTVRHQGRMPHDDDADMGVHKEDLEKLDTLRDQFKALGYGFTRDIDEGITEYKIYCLKFIEVRGRRVQPWVDVFGFEEQESGRYVYTTPNANKIFPNDWLLKEQFEKPKKVRFGSIKIPVPSDDPVDPSSYFVRNYGPNWREKAVYSGMHGEKNYPTYRWTLKGPDFKPGGPTGPLLDR